MALAGETTVNKKEKLYTKTLCIIMGKSVIINVYNVVAQNREGR